ncbi:MAG: sodium:proton antiporter [Moraxellaceae bacterium]|nr:MAG: sodium:proton antiporter [Moraxellaceae bacterium]
MMELSIAKIGLLLVIAAFVAMLARRFHFPYTVGLLIAGIGMAFVPFIPTLELTKELIFTALLPPLIFEAALFLPWKELKQVMPQAISIASVGLIFSAVVTGLGMFYLLDWPVYAATVFGVLIAATDPVSVIATFKEAGVEGKLKIMVESESLFNDGVAAVLFGLAIALASSTQEFSAIGIVLNMGYVIGGGLLAGAAVGVIALYVLSKTSDHLIELTFSAIGAYGSFMLAEHFHCSGVLATLTTGVIVGNLGHIKAISSRGNEAIEHFWEFAAYIANSIIFLLIGLYEAKQFDINLLMASACAIVLVLLGRMIAIYPVAALFRNSKYRIPATYQHIMVWGGLRGALALALALGLPNDMVYRSQIITVTFVVVGFSILVQGITITPLLKRFGVLNKSS